MSVLGRNEIIRRFQSEKILDRLFVTPLFLPAQVSGASIDIRISNDFIITKRGNLPFVDAAQTETHKERYQGKHYTNFSRKILLASRRTSIDKYLGVFSVSERSSGASVQYLRDLQCGENCQETE